MILFRVIHQLLCQKYEYDRPPESKADMFPRRFPKARIGLITHHQHQCDVDEGLSAGQAVGEMEAMPYKVQHINGKAGIKQQQQAAVHCLFPECNLPAAQIQKEKHKHGNAAV